MTSTTRPNGNGSGNGAAPNGSGAPGSNKSSRRKRSLSVRGAYSILSVFAMGALHVMFDRRVIRPTRQLSLALVRNEFLDRPPTKIVVLGEIHSGDNYAANVLRGAFGKGMTVQHDHVHRRDLLGPDELSDIAGRTDVLWVMAVRSPCAWADSLIEFQKELCQKGELPKEECTAHDFASAADYYRIPWYDWRHDDDAGKVENIVESHEGHSLKYDDIFDLRTQKLLLMKQIMDAVPRHVKILRLSEFELNPDVFVKDLVKEYQFTLKKDYAPPMPGVDPQSKSFDPETIFSCLENSKWKEAQQRIDWTLEGYFGHNHLECHLCRGDGGAIGAGGKVAGTLSNIYVLGERNSGTTFVSNTLATAFDPPNTMGSKVEKFSSDIPILLHKHMFRHDPLNREELEVIRARDDILWILVVRSPCDWAEGMFRKPYHLCPPKQPERCGPESDPDSKIWMNQNTVRGISLLEFMTETEWADWPESVPFMRGVDGDNKKGGEEVSISKVSENYTYPSVFGLRQHKLEIMKQIIETVPRNVKFVRLKELERSPEIFIQSIVREFNMTLKEGYASLPPSKVAHPTVCLTNHEWDAAQKGIDWKAEAEFGFSPFDCRMCYGYDKSTRLYDRVQAGKKVRKTIEGKTIEGEKPDKAMKRGKKEGAKRKVEEREQEEEKVSMRKLWKEKVNAKKAAKLVEQSEEKVSAQKLPKKDAGKVDKPVEQDEEKVSQRSYAGKAVKRVEQQNEERQVKAKKAAKLVEQTEEKVSEQRHLKTDTRNMDKSVNEDEEKVSQQSDAGKAVKRVEQKNEERKVNAEDDNIVEQTEEKVSEQRHLESDARNTDKSVKQDDENVSQQRNAGKAGKHVEQQNGERQVNAKDRNIVEQTEEKVSEQRHVESYARNIDKIVERQRLLKNNKNARKRGKGVEPNEENAPGHTRKVKLIDQDEEKVSEQELLKKNANKVKKHMDEDAEKVSKRKLLKEDKNASKDDKLVEQDRERALEKE